MAQILSQDLAQKELIITRDLAQVSVLARSKKVPLLLLVSRQDCPYCHLIKREVIRPMLISGEYDNRILMREIMIDYAEQLIGFSGVALPAAKFAQQYGVRLTPTLLFLSAQGKELAERIVGVNTLDFLSWYIDESIDKARSASGLD